MADVFVSYARPDERQAKRVADALREQGFTVWRDDELPAHRAYTDVILERLNESRAVVVLWSAEASRSQWVRAEADAARQASTLVQVTLDGSLPPLPFNQIQCADLRDWRGSPQSDGWRKLTTSVAALIGAPARDSAAAMPVRRTLSICVLPFVNMSGDAEQEYFSDGISEDITTDLSKISALAVTARNTAFTFKGQAVDVCDVARKLGVRHILEGSVRKAGGRVRITAQLIDGATGDHVWAERYDRELTDIFAIQDEISKSIVDALKLKLHPEEEKAIEHRGTTSVDAYNLYLLARQTWQTGAHGDSRREKTVIRLCDRIIKMEPGYGAAWGLKALAEATLFFGYNEGTEDGVKSADRAIELDPSVADAYCAKARAFSDRRDFPEAERLVAKAVELAPDSWDANKQAASTYTWQRRFAEAEQYFRRCIEILPADLFAWDMLIMVYRAIDDPAALKETARGLYEAAAQAIEKDPSNCTAFGRGANALVVLGEIDRATEWMDRALLIDPDNLDIRFNFACTLINHSDRFDLMFEYLDYVFARSVGSIIRRADLDSDLDRIRDHPHFQEIYAAAMKRLADLDARKNESISPDVAGVPLRS